MSQSPESLHSVAWRELFPWVLLFRSWKTALSPSLLGLAVGALLATHCGWWLVGRAFAAPPLEVAIRLEQIAADHAPNTPARPVAESTARAFLNAAPWNDLIRPLVYLSSPSTTIREAAFHLLGWVFAVAVWSFVGGVIARWTIVSHAAGQETDIFEVGQFVGSRYLQFFLAPLAPVGAIVLLIVLLTPIGWLMRFDLGVLLAGLLWIGVLLVSVVGAWLMVGLLAGLPLMWGVLAAQKDADCLQAFSDAFSYVFGRPLNYAAYALLSLGIAFAACFLVDFVSERVVQFGYLGVSWGASQARLVELQAAASEAQQGRLSLSARESGAYLIRAAMHLPRLVAQAYQAVLLMVLATTIFLLLRRDVDDKEINDVYIEQNEPPPQRKPPPGAIAVTQSPAPADQNSAE